ncbi:MAG TPA: hypothetical protein VKZ61_15135, partial [Thermomicrobiales bacterium]|nr:hypothetical protein [Thermomicrobiales bacterium]
MLKQRRRFGVLRTISVILLTLQLMYSGMLAASAQDSGGAGTLELVVVDQTGAEREGAVFLIVPVGDDAEDDGADAEDDGADTGDDAVDAVDDGTDVTDAVDDTVDVIVDDSV